MKKETLNIKRFNQKAVLWLMTAILAISTGIVGFSRSGGYEVPAASAASSTGNSLSLVEISDDLDMDGLQPYSPKSRDDILKKLSAMGTYTSSIDPARMLYRMDDDEALMKAMRLKSLDVKKGFWATIASAFKNLFGGGSTSKGCMSNFLDGLIFAAVVIVGLLAIFIIYKIISRILKKE